MPPQTLDANEKESLMRASDLIKAAGWEKKALTIQDFLSGKGDLFTDPDMDEHTVAETKANKTPQTMTFNPTRQPLKTGNPARPLEKSDPEFVTLAATLLHEADHAHHHGEIEAYGEEITFCKTINEEFDKYLPGMSADQKAAIEKRKREWEDNAKRQRENYIKNAGKPKEDGDKHMLKFARLIFKYEDRTGHVPQGDNADAVAQLRDFFPAAIASRDLNQRGEFVDSKRRPYIYRAPGEIYPELFDLSDADGQLFFLYRR